MVTEQVIDALHASHLLVYRTSWCGCTEGWLQCKAARRDAAAQQVDGTSGPCPAQPSSLAPHRLCATSRYCHTTCMYSKWCDGTSSVNPMCKFCWGTWQIQHVFTINNHGVNTQINHCQRNTTEHSIMAVCPMCALQGCCICTAWQCIGASQLGQGHAGWHMTCLSQQAGG